MSATLAMKNVKVRAFGTKVTVPNNAMASLMYYLDCVSTVIDYKDRSLTDFQNYDELTGEELVAVYALAKIFHPSIFINAGIFIIDQKLLFGNSNQFYEITDETIGFHANREIMIGGKVRKVLKLMACNDYWLSKYYFGPIKQLDDLVKRIENVERNRNYQKQIVNTQTPVKEKTEFITAEFQSSPVTITCPFCRNIITTKTESKLNFVACICCLMFNILYCCVQMCGDRNPCCLDISHRCPKCGKIVGHYNSC